ncbi:hypothetical protein DL93DRAFT_2232919 [Clavulina sp. PMI_390]|nr:hypothetical protein DL93DRAFT_2232919 [Clavulina sp. PMI_390]
MLVDLNAWSVFEKSKTLLLQSLKLPPPCPTPVLAFEPRLREEAHAASHQITSESSIHINRVQDAIQELSAAKRHLEICSARVQTSLAPIAGLTPSLLSDIFCIAVDQFACADDKQIHSFRAVCSSWRDIIDDTSELFTRWAIGLQVWHNIELIRHWRSRSKGRPITVTIGQIVWFPLLDSMTVQNEESSSGDIIKDELELALPRMGCATKL